MKRLFPAIFASFLLVGAGCLPFGGTGSPEPSSVEPVRELFGAAESYKEDARELSVRTADGGVEDVKLPDSIGNGKEAVGELVKVDGERELSTRVITATSLEVQHMGNLVVTSPTPNATVTSPLVVFGFGRTFEQQFAWRIKDDSFAVVAQGHAFTHAPDGGMYGPFRLDIILPALKEKAFTLEVLTFSAKDGSEKDLVSVPLSLLTTETTTVQAYFPNASKGSGRDCSLVFPVGRTIAKTSTVGRAALEALLAGPTAAEIRQGYSTSINRATELNSLSINEQGTATADFSPELNAAGSCRVTSIRAQIDQTLSQFPTVNDVVITVDGKEDDVLQP
jgi:hypothetical protein